jgi:flagellar hook protein FlgE
MLQAMLSGVASIKAHQSRMNVIGNNLANTSTTAYKGQRVNFADMMSQTTQGASGATTTRGGVNPTQYGLGVYVGGTDVNFEQGGLSQTNRPTDLAIQGNGFFVTSNSTRMAYTRDGSFDLDSTGVLTHQATGERVLGWTADNNGVIDSTTPLTSASTISIPVGNMSTVKVTDSTSFSGNLNSTSLPTDTVVTKMRVYDSLGGAHDISLKVFNRQGPAAGTPPAGALSSWDWEMYEGDPSTGTLLGGSASAGNERLYFDANGARVTSLATGTNNQVTVASATVGLYPAFTIDVKFPNMSQLVSKSQVNGIDQNGFPSGTLENYSISKDGVITGIFSNGLTRSLGQLGMAKFSNPEGMNREGGNLFTQSNNSGTALIGTANDSGMGTINAGYLEQANVDMSGEMTDLIVTQRGFQANTKIVTTVDEMLQELINIKR